LGGDFGGELEGDLRGDAQSRGGGCPGDAQEMPGGMLTVMPGGCMGGGAWGKPLDFKNPF
jgi:hypothetical protein